MVKVKIKRLTENAVVPTKAHPTDAGFDLTATSRVFDEEGNIVYGFGLAFEIPEGYVGLLFPRSSICKKDLTLSNSVGVVDCHYRGEVFAKFRPTLLVVDKPNVSEPKTIIDNGFEPGDYSGSVQTDFSTQEVTFPGRNENYPDIAEGCKPLPPRMYDVGDRCAQMIIIPILHVKIEETEELSETDRGDGGYGYTGLK